MDKARNSIDSLWNSFAREYGLTPKQLAQCQQYADMLIARNNDFNLTAITDMADVIAYHFKDSLAALSVAQFSSSSSIADVGTGAGFPGIPLKIMAPDKKLYLIEVNQKKIMFLNEVIEALHLEGVTIIDQDWRAFLRDSHKIDFFCARASLQPEELVRLFKPASTSHKASLVYWASQLWQPSAEVKKYIRYEISYHVGDKTRRLVVMQAS